ncbi:pentatricopeptide repeat protein [Artemisia annua]|uniref:Pentatricopeptide repeat protein n=1 Tax=Artemisia annua TaxID=35608 RepID=A0A2U1KHY2_ARTAN|nr:pentatricopeptide repeat protein [Artemisia annua]
MPLTGAYLKVEMTDKAMETYEIMKPSGCVPYELTLMIMIRNLENARRDDLVDIIKNDCVEYLDSPKKFFEEEQWSHESNYKTTSYSHVLYIQGKMVFSLV